MGKTQKSISISANLWEEIEQLYMDNKDILNALEISSPAEFFRVLANFGKKPFMDFLAHAKT